MTARRHDCIINVDEAQRLEAGKGRFGVSTARLGAPAGARQLGCNWMELKPGKTSFPYHYHTGIEEALYILSGCGEVRIGAERIAVRAGDYIAFPAGPEHAHALTNTGAVALTYLALSNQNVSDIVGYPDSRKFLFMALPDPATWPHGMWVRKLVRDQESVDYYEGEDTAE